MDLEEKTIKELQALAKKRGLSGYSKLSKPQLLRELRKADAARKKAAPKKAAAKKPPKDAPGAKAKATKKRPAAPQAPVKRAPPPPTSLGTPETPERAHLDAGETEVEHAKFALTPRGADMPSHLLPDLGEDIDRLPALRRAHLALLPQKPGILHAYWILPREMLDRRPPLMLRLCRVTQAGIEVVQELELPHERGHWYFHLPVGVPEPEFCVQIGQYRDHAFFTALPRGTARMPVLFAARRTSREWWVSPEQFRAMYLRAGGHEEGGELAWSASTSSRSAP